MTEEDMAVGYRFMTVGYAASRELFLMSFKLRARDSQWLSRQLMFKGNFPTEWAVRCWHVLLWELWRWMAPAGPERDQPY